MKIVLLLDEEQVPCDESGDSELLLQLHQEGTSKLRLPKFPGGAEVLRHARIPEIRASSGAWGVGSNVVSRSFMLMISATAVPWLKGHGNILKPNRYPEDVSVGH
eukprot:s4615_g1.t1